MLKTIPLVVITLVALAWILAAGAAAPSSQPTTTRGSTAPKELILDLGDKMTLKLVQIPAGKFLMGSPATEKDHQTDEVQHEVTISKPFYMGITHVTVNQFALFAQDIGYKTDAERDGYSFSEQIKEGTFDFVKVNGLTWKNPGFDQKGDHPVVQVSWNDAQGFCAWLSKKSGRTVGLPTEAQWEYACRAGANTAFPWGDNPDDGKGWANCADQTLKRKLPNWKSDFFNWDDGFVYTSPVANFRPNAFGIYDMIGNVRQWCQDCFGDYEMGAATDPTGAPSGDYHVVRGACWHDFPRGGRIAFRSGDRTNFSHDGDGFRVAAVAEDGK